MKLLKGYRGELMSKEEIMKIIEEKEKIYFDSNCTIVEAVEKAKEVMKCCK